MPLRGPGVALASRLRAKPGPRYVHPKATANGQHDASLDTASEAAPNYLRWIADLCRPHLGQSVLEVGAGIGSITDLYADGRDVLATDVSDHCVVALRQRFADTSNVRVEHADVRTLDASEHFDSILMVNVLEHIEDDAGTLASLKPMLRPRGTIVIYVPALNGLYGAWDQKVGHFRRYSKWRLREVAREAGLSVAELRYLNALAVPAWAAFSRTNIDRTVSNSLSLWDRTGVPVSRLIESMARPPLGLNLLAVLRDDDRGAIRRTG